MRCNKVLCLVIVFCMAMAGAMAQSVERGHESAKGTVNVSALSAYLALHPEPLVVREIDDDDDDIAMPVPGLITDSSMIRRRTTPRGIPGAYVPVTPSLPVSPSPSDTFESTLDNGTLIPPDTHGAVDSNYCVTAINQAVTIQSKTTHSTVSTVSLNSFFNSINSVGGTFDPRVHYDPYTNRWILICVSGANNSSDSTSILIGVSKTSNPTGAWWLYKVRAYTAGGYWLDFPDVGYNSKWITVTGNLFQNSPGTGYNGAKVFVFNKANLLSGTGASYTAFTQSSSFTICPALTYDTTESTLWAVERWNGAFGAMKFWKITGAVGSESMSSVGFPISPNTWQEGSNQVSGTFGADFAPQAGTSNLIQTNDSRVTQMIYINGYLWFAHTVFLPYSSSANATRASVQWWQMDTTGTPVQVGLIDDPTNTNFYAFPSIAVNSSNDALIGFAAFSSSTYPSSAYAVRSHSDASDSIRLLDVFRHGQNSYYKTFGAGKNRWGDYSGAAIDPTNMSDFWTIQEASASTSNTWDTWWAHVLAPCSAPSSITGTLSVCVGQTTTLSDATSGGTWSSGTTSVATIGSTGIVTGVSSGTSVITYSVGSGCTATATVTVNANPGTITGSSAICVGLTGTESSSPSGGTWSSSNTSIATIGSTGIVTGVSSGTVTISYTLSTGCYATKSVTVNPNPSAITGTLSICVGGTTTLSSSPGGGTWSSSNVGVASVGSGSVVTGVSAGTAFITYTLATTGCFTVAQVTVNATSAISGPTSVCVGGNITLTDGTTGGSWSSSNSALATVGTGSGIVTGVAAGTVTISYTLSSGCYATYPVTVTAAPGSITGTLTVCSGSTTTLSCSPSGGTWTSGTTSVATVGSSSGIVAGVSPGTSVITYSLGTGCTSTATVTVNAAPGAITGPNTVCVGGSITLADGSVGGSWTSGNPSLASVGSGSGVVTGVAAGTVTITYTLSGGCFATYSVTVTAAPGSITGTLTVCSGSTTTLSCSPSGGTWTSGTTGVATIGSSSGIVTGASPGTSVITYSLGTGCTSTATVTVNAAPAAIAGPSFVCDGQTITLTDGTIGGSWSCSDVTKATVGSGSGVVTGIGVGTATISYTLTSDGCYATAPITVGVTPAAISGPTAICNGTTGTLTDLSSGGTWSSSNSALITIGSSSGIMTGVAVGCPTMTYTLSNTCYTTYGVCDQVAPTVISTTTTSICVGNTTTFSDLTSGGTWSSSTPGIATVGTGTGVVSGVAAGTATITYTLTSDGCFTTQPITVVATPAAITGTTTVCVGVTTTLSSSPGGGTWSSTAPSIATVGSTGVVTGVAAGNATISYTLGGSCEVSTVVTVNSSPGAITGTFSTCIGQTTSLSDPTSGGAWTSSNISIATVGSASGVVSGVAAGVATISYSIGSGCYATTNVTVTTTPGAITGALGVCLGATTTLGCSPAGGTWTSVTPAVATIGSSSGIVTGVSSGTSVISYSLGAGCVATATVTVNTGAAPITGTAGACTGTTTTLSDIVGGGTWTSSNTAVATIGSGTGIVTGIAPGFSTITYSVGTGCVATVTVTIHPIPAIVSVIGGGGYCSGGSGVNVGISGSAVGLDYQLYRGGVAVGSLVPGIGGTLYFGLQTVAGVYTVTAVDPVTLCTNNMSGSATVSIYALPNAYNVTGGGSYCSGGTGFPVGLSSSDAGVNYQLYRSGSPVGSAVAGTGAAINFGLQTVAGVYTVVGTSTGLTGCSNTMTGSVTIVVNPLPNAYTVTGGGGYCPGGSGVVVGLSNSDAGVNYQLLLGTSPVGSPVAGTGSSISFGLQTTAGTYTVVATNTLTGCTKTMTGSAVVSLYTLPTVYTVTGGGSYCAGGTGVAVGLSASSYGINYQLYRGGVAVGSPVAGTGAVITFGLQTVSGTYTVVATNATTGCSANMTGSAVVNTTTLPNIYTVTGGGDYCTGGTGLHVGLSNSDIGTNYQLYRGTTTVGSALAGTGAALDFGLQTTAGTYTVVATISGTVCTANMSGSVTITIDPLPTAYTVTGGGSYCIGGTGVVVGLSHSDLGINYQLYNSGVPVGSVIAGTGVPISFGLQTAGGIYTVVATNTATGCTNNMTGSVTITVNALPAVYTVTGGGGYCTGGTGIAVGLSGSQTGVSYQLYLGGVLTGSAVTGTGAAISFGLQTSAGIYTVVATNTSTGCTNNMTGSTTITINPLPTAYTVTGGGSYCSGGTGVTIGLGTSDVGVNYQLYRGTTVVGAPVAGTGVSISFGLQTVVGTYTVVATDATTGCANTMSGSATVSINPLPAIVSVTGGGGYCSGGSGVVVGLSASAAGINYQLYLGTAAVGSPIVGTGAAISFGLQTVAGTYTATATNATTGCTDTMSGSATVTISSLPVLYTVTGGGSYCSGGTGVAIGLSGSSTSVNYQLYRGGVPLVGTIVAGTGAAISFGLQTVAGTYTVVATAVAGGCADTMTGSATITINPLPNAYTVTGGGSYCIGGTGVTIGLNNSDVGVSYQLMLGTSPMGAPVAGVGSAISFGTFTTAGTYTVVATNTVTGCVNNMTGSVTITINPLPTAFTVTGGGSYCAGGSGVVVGLSASTYGVNYQLYNGSIAVGSPVPGTGAAISFGLQTTAGTYTVVATNATTGCTNTMAGSVVVSVTVPPAVFTVTGGGSYCAGGSGVLVGLSGSQSSVNYQLYRSGLPVGSAVAGTGSSISFGLETTAGTYTVVATIVGTGCTDTMTGRATVTVDPLPTVFTVTGGGGYCTGGSGVTVGLSGSQLGVNYSLYQGTTLVGAASGTGSALSFGTFTSAGIYTVVATDGFTGCIDNMSGSAVISVNPLPTVETVTGGGSYCSGGTGVAVGLSSSQVGVNYQLYFSGSPMGSAVVGTGIAISFGLRTSAGTYTVVATNATTGCTDTMAGSATITVNPLPSVFTVTGGGSYCSGGTGVLVGLSGSQTSVNYQLYRGTAAIGSPVAGTGASISFGLQTVTGTYTVVATTTLGCTATMSGSATITINPLPAPIPVTGGGSFCTGGAGVHVGLAGSVVGISYQLMRGTSTVGSPLAGTGTSLDFGAQTIAGTYTVVATNTTTLCTNNMSGSATVVVNPTPAVYTVTGGGSYCSGGTGLTVGLSGSSTGVRYQLYRGGSAVGSAVIGTGSALSFGLQTVAGTYTVVATNISTSCTANMSGSAVITVNPLPTAYTVTGGGSYCSGGTGVSVGLASSQSGVNYQLYLSGTTVGSPVVGTGAAISFGLQTTAGTYTVVGTNATTGCSGNMSGYVIITINPLPTAYTVTGGGSYCSGGTGLHVGLSGSATGVSYQLYLGGTPTGIPIMGSGVALDFGLHTVAGTYTVVATNTTTTCVNNMSGSVTITVSTAPTAYTVTGGGAYCSGGTGVHIGLAGSSLGVSYQVKLGTTSVGPSLAGTGSVLDFGLFTSTGTYTIVATNTTTGCTATMTGTAIITINPLPAAFTVTGGGAYCLGGTGVHVGLSSSVGGINYQLYNGITPVGAPMAGTGVALDFGLQTVVGTYTVVAQNPTTGCIANMSGSVTVSTTTTPAAYTVTGGGSYCSGGSGVAIGLSGSQSGVSYQLYLGTSPSGAAVAGTGSAISFGARTTAGTYTVVATRSGTVCSTNMTGSATITVNTAPTVDTVTGGGTICSAGPGVHVGLNTSTSGVNYQLYRSGTAVGTPLAGSGSPLDFGAFTTAGTYTVIATNPTTGCTSAMHGSAVITITTSPTVIAMTGGGAYCSGGTGVHVGLAASSIGVNYQLYRGGVAVGSPIPGIGAALDFGLETVGGTYTATGTYAGTTCSSNMSGSETVTVDPLPTVYTVTGGGSYCSGGTGVVVGLSGSSSGVSYKLLRTGTPVTSLSGTGSSLSFGLYTTAGTYTIVAMNTVTGCTDTMSGSAVITINPNPTVSGTIYTVAPSGTITLTGSISGGTWASSATSIATIGSGSGVVTGVALGTAVMTYTLPTGCFGSHIISVTPTGHREEPGTTVATGISNISVTPNPNHGTFVVKGALSSADDEACTIEVTNMLGQVIYSGKTVVHNGDLEQTVQLSSSVANGMYLLTVHSATDSKVFHIVVEQ